MQTFIDYLLEQNVNVTLDAKDPAGSLAKAKEMLRMSDKNPQRAIKQRQMNIKDGKKVADATGDKDEANIKNMEDKVARMRMMSAKKKERAEAAAES